MLTTILLFPLASVMGLQQEPQTPPTDRKVRIEVVTTENGETKRSTKEFNAADDAQLQEALRELGVLGQFKLGSGERDLTIDIRGFGGPDDEALMLRMAPVPPVPPVPPAGFPAEPSAYLGVSTRNLTKEDRKERKLFVGQGAIVLEVAAGSPAEKLGLRVDDVITECDGKAVDGPQRLAELVGRHKPGDEVKLVWLRNGKTMDANVKLSQRESRSYAFRLDGTEPDIMRDLELHDMPGAWMSERRAFLGITPAPKDDQGPGVPIESVEEGSAANRMGLQPGDRITAINGVVLAEFDSLAAFIRGMKPGDPVKVEALRAGTALQLEGALGERKAHWFRSHGEPGQSFRMEGWDPASREEFRREMDDLRREMDQFRQELGRDIRREVRVHVQARELSDDEKALLRNKGVAVDKQLVLEGLQVFPNPSNGFYRLRFDVAERADLAVEVHNAKGERVYQERLTGFKGRYERTLDLTDLAAGSYYLVITQGGRTATGKLVKE